MKARSLPRHEAFPCTAACPVKEVYMLSCTGLLIGAAVLPGADRLWSVALCQVKQ